MSHGPAPDARAVEEFYDARYQGEYMAAHPPLERMRVGETLRLVPRDTDAVLDYGCGSGAWADVLARSFPRASLAGVEVSSRAAKAAARRSGGAMSVLHFDGERAPFDDGRFGLVFSYHVLEHVVDLGATVADMARLTRPGGFVVACLPCANRGSVMERAARVTRGGVEASATGEARFFFEDPGHLRSVTTSELELLFARHGMKLRHAWHTGALADAEYLALRRHRIVDLFQPARARTRPAAAALSLARGALLALERAVRVHLASLRGGGAPRACVLVCAKLPAALVGVPVLYALPRWEWRRRRGRPAGSSQYLVFERATH